MYPYLLLLAITFLLPPDNDNRIDWTANRKLAWGDFQGQPVQNSDNVALTSSHINTHEVTFRSERPAKPFTCLAHNSS